MTIDKDTDSLSGVSQVDSFNIFVCQNCRLMMSGNNILAESNQNELFTVVTPQEAEETLNIGSHFQNICACCLGLMQLVTSPVFLDWMEKRIQWSGYEFNCFNVNFKLPLSLKIRQKIIFNHLSGQSSSFTTEFDLKATLKNILSNEISKRSKQSVSPSEDFIIYLDFSNSKDEISMVH